MGLAHGNYNERKLDPIVSVTAAGSIAIIDLNTGAIVKKYDLGEAVVASPLLVRGRFNDSLVVPGHQGTLYLLEFNSISTGEIRQRWVRKLDYANKFAEGGRARAKLGAQPAYHKGLIFQGLARETTFDAPPLAAIHLETGEVHWSEWQDEEPAESFGFGNLRGAPIIIDDQVIFATAYSGGLSAVALADGRPLWTVELGQGMFEQWSSPVAMGHSIFLGRHDGYLHKIDVRERRREWSARRRFRIAGPATIMIAGEVARHAQGVGRA